MKKLLLLLALVFGASPALAQNYNATAGSGLVFGAKSASSVLYPYFIGCDATTPTQCWAVDASGRLTVNINGTVTVTGTVTANLGTIAGVATATNQTNKAQFTQLTDGTNPTGTFTAYGTAPTGNWPGVNAFVTNTNPNGATAPSSASPVTPSNLPVGGANFANTQVSVGSTATSIIAARTGVAGTGRISATVCNTSTIAVYLGGSGVTTSTGQYLAGVAGACATFNTTAAIYGIVVTGTETVGATEVY